MRSFKRRRTGSVTRKGGVEEEKLREKEEEIGERLVARFSTTPLSSTLASGIARELVKHLLYMRQQIPSTWPEVERLSREREAAQREPTIRGNGGEGSTKNRRLRRMRKLEVGRGKRAAKLCDAAEALMRDGVHAVTSAGAGLGTARMSSGAPVRPSHMDEFFAAHDVRRAAVLFGSSIITPKETYLFRFHMPATRMSEKASDASSVPVVSSRLLAAATRKVVKTIITQGWVSGSLSCLALAPACRPHHSMCSYTAGIFSSGSFGLARCSSSSKGSQRRANRQGLDIHPSPRLPHLLPPCLPPPPPPPHRRAPRRGHRQRACRQHMRCWPCASLRSSFSVLAAVAVGQLKVPGPLLSAEPAIETRPDRSSFQSQGFDSCLSVRVEVRGQGRV